MILQNYTYKCMGRLHNSQDLKFFTCHLLSNYGMFTSLLGGLWLWSHLILTITLVYRNYNSCCFTDEDKLQRDKVICPAVRTWHTRTTKLILFMLHQEPRIQEEWHTFPCEREKETQLPSGNEFSFFKSYFYIIKPHLLKRKW